MMQDHHNSSVELKLASYTTNSDMCYDVICVSGRDQ